MINTSASPSIEYEADNSTSDSLQTAPPNADLPQAADDTIMYSARFTIGVVSIVTNSLVVAVIASRKKMLQKNTNIFIINQSVLDFVAGLLALVPLLKPNQTSGLEGYWDDLYCKLWVSEFFFWSIMCSSTYNLVSVTLERYVAVLHAVWHRQHYTKRVLAGALVLAWLAPPPLLYFLIPTSGVVNGFCEIYILWPNDATRKVMAWYTAIVFFVIPLAFHIYCYGRMYRVFKKATVAPQTAPLQNTAPNRPSTREANQERIRRNIFTTMLSVTIVFFLCWVWDEILWILVNFDMVDEQTFQGLYRLTFIAVSLNACVNPVIYVTKYEEFQRAVRAILCRHKMGMEESMTTESSIRTVSTA